MTFQIKSKNLLYLLLNCKKCHSSFAAKYYKNNSEPQNLDAPHADAVKNASSQFPYYIENGLRKVYPYYFTHSVYCKGRWVKRNLIDCYTNEFSLYSRDEFIRRVTDGLLKVNGKTVSVDYILKNADFIQSTVHRHELAVLATPIQVVFEDEELLVIDKPPSLPVHPCALYMYNSVHNILSLEYGYKNLYVAHRLDRLTSGILIYAKSSKKSRELHDLFNLRNIRKEYVCRVEGHFPDGVIVCNKPIKQVYNKIGINIVSPLGKTSITEFTKLSFNGKSSVVLCKPHTGRTHQIRVHLQYLGHPIVNDLLYNSYAFGPQKGKNGFIDKSLENLMEDLVKEQAAHWQLDNSLENTLDVCDVDKDLLDFVTRMYSQHLDPVFKGNKYKKDKLRITYDGNCYYCKRKHHNPQQTNLMMLLHAYKYESDDWQFKTEMPLWAADNWSSV